MGLNTTNIVKAGENASIFFFFQNVTKPPKKHLLSFEEH